MVKQNRLFIVHGWEGHPQIHWLSWLKKQAEAMGMLVQVPAFPNADNPIAEEWTTTLQQTVVVPTKHDFFVGHSLGAIAILRYLETLNGMEKIGGAIFVAGFATSLGIKQTESFFEGTVAFERVKKTALHGFVAINSDNDPYVPWNCAEELRDKLNAKLICMHGAGHINTDAGYVELPEAVEALKSLTKQR